MRQLKFTFPSCSSVSVSFSFVLFSVVAVVVVVVVKYPSLATITISRSLLFRWPAQRVAITGWTWHGLLMRRTATRPSRENLGGVCVQRSTSSLMSARALRSRMFLRMGSGVLLLHSAFQAEITSKVDVRLGALSRDTQSLIVFFVCVLNTESMGGKGSFHFRVVPRSPCVPMAARYRHDSAIEGWSVLQMVYVNSEAVDTGGQSQADTTIAPSGFSPSVRAW